MTQISDNSHTGLSNEAYMCKLSQNTKSLGYEVEYTVNLGHILRSMKVWEVCKILHIHDNHWFHYDDWSLSKYVLSVLSKYGELDRQVYQPGGGRWILHSFLIPRNWLLLNFVERKTPRRNPLKKLLSQCVKSTGRCTYLTTWHKSFSYTVLDVLRISATSDPLCSAQIQ